MGKRSDFPRIEKDFYRTFDPKAVAPLIPVLREMGIRSFIEPCAGAGDLIRQLEGYGLCCLGASDIDPKDHMVDVAGGHMSVQSRDALDLTPEHVVGCGAIITNPPWSREILHLMINHFTSLSPTWLLFDADWAHTVQACPYMDLCERIVSVGKVNWIPGTKQSGKDNCAWYLFRQRTGDAQTVFTPYVGKEASMLRAAA